MNGIEKWELYVISIGFENYYRVPWDVFRDMKQIFGYKYMDESNLEQYKIKYSNGVVKFLDGLELREREES